MRALILAGAAAALLGACASTTDMTSDEFVFPEGLKIMEGGYPYVGGPCRLLGETFVTSELLDDSADLLGCPRNAMQDPRVRAAGRVVGEYEGVVLVSVPKRPAQ